MAFGHQENSRDRGEPVSLVQFRYGVEAFETHSYTDAEQDFVFNGVTYQAVPIDIGEITSSGNLDNATLSISMAQTAEIVDIFRLRPPSSVVTVIIRQGHINDVDEQFIVGWSGRVTGFEVDGTDDTATFGCEPISTSMQRTMLRRHWQYGCPLVLYGPQCRASRARATSAHVVRAVAGAIITLDATWTPDARKLKHQGGIAEWTIPGGQREIRRILRCDASGIVQLGNAADGLLPGATISMILGCNHKTGIPTLNDDGDCAPLHNNILNFGGDPWIPTENPVGFKNNYY